ncbi:hypothetical protein CVU82_01790 [Candidatus Falkowbacteria bacterium HGW-Falkowbacteria-1]|jgi:hypothetical protein|uniref:Uncharacterized protein n=1 Tax=Candidatus Falkowbacteria bacterium HGW-Falkowbacteria-1 TaxID=2013768 RepID=A0A2N2E9B5_9BACT|nr:MAG: hypothetical protein CVU82_01790 [Candidatus Falkowbacteria bacterium HGW-Falkowbacteria-1]
MTEEFILEEDFVELSWGELIELFVFFSQLLSFFLIFSFIFLPFFPWLAKGLILLIAIFSSMGSVGSFWLRGNFFPKFLCFFTYFLLASFFWWSYCNFSYC